MLAGSVLTLAILAAPSVGSAPTVALASGPFISARVLGPGLNEPEIKVAADGTIYVDAIPGLFSPSTLFRSQDGGGTWVKTPLGLRGDSVGGGDATVAVDPAGGVYMSDLWLGSTTTSVSKDHGNTWISNPAGGGFGEDRQWLAASDSAQYLVYHQIPSGLLVSRSVKGGYDYEVTTVGATPLDQTGCVCPPGNIIAESGKKKKAGLKDNVGFIFVTSAGGVKFARSTDGGAIFGISDIAFGGATIHSFPVVADAGGGNLHAVWLQVGSGTQVMYSTSANWGQTWSSPRTVVSAGTSVYPWVAAQGGKVAVSLFHTDTVTNPDNAPGGTSWFESYLESNDGGANWSGLSNADGTPVKSGAICTQGLNCGGDRDLGDFQSVAVDGQGRANLTWARATGGGSAEIRFTRQA